MVAVTSLIQRQQALQAWAGVRVVELGMGALQGDLAAVSGDASFRRYFRGHTPGGTVVLVDAPPDRENSAPFIDVARRLLAAGVRAPSILAADMKAGFLCLEDFGNDLLWPAVDRALVAGDHREARNLYQRCFDALLLIQRADAGGLPLYDNALLLREMRLFSEWFCGGVLQLALTPADNAIIEGAFAALAGSAEAQPQVFVHRDYHSRNLMLLAGGDIGVIDFQDAVRGPVTYDLVSLLKDCYIEWPRQEVNAWALAYAAQAERHGILSNVVAAHFLRDFDLMGAQRHIKVLGIFSRLWLRDGKPGYLKDIPLTFRYLQQVVGEHAELAEFAAWLQTNIATRLSAALAKAAQQAGATR